MKSKGCVTFTSKWRTAMDNCGFFTPLLMGPAMIPTAYRWLPLRAFHETSWNGPRTSLRFWNNKRVALEQVNRAHRNRGMQVKRV